MASPSLVIRRVVVAGNLSCDLKFERGLNIIQAVATHGDVKSTHKSGKTSLVELIQHRGKGLVEQRSDHAVIFDSGIQPPAVGVAVPGNLVMNLGIAVDDH